MVCRNLGFLLLWILSFLFNIFELKFFQYFSLLSLFNIFLFKFIKVLLQKIKKKTNALLFFCEV